MNNCFSQLHVATTLTMSSTPI